MFSRRIKEPLPPVWDLRPPNISPGSNHPPPAFSKSQLLRLPQHGPGSPGYRHPNINSPLPWPCALDRQRLEPGDRAVRPRTSNARIRLLTPLLQQGWVQVEKCLPLIWESNAGGPAVNH